MFILLRIIPLRCLTFVVAVCFTLPAIATEGPLHQRIDQLLDAAHPSGGTPLASDADFIRRAYLTLTGVIPTAAQARQFIADSNPQKRAALVEQLINSRDFPRWMAVQFDVMLMERRPEKHVKGGGW